MLPTTYSTYNDAVDEIIAAIEASNVVEDARAEYDIDAIAEEVIEQVSPGLIRVVRFQITDDTDAFWDAVARHAL